MGLRFRRGDLRFRNGLHFRKGGFRSSFSESSFSQLPKNGAFTPTAFTHVLNVLVSSIKTRFQRHFPRHKLLHR